MSLLVVRRREAKATNRRKSADLPVGFHVVWFAGWVCQFSLSVVKSSPARHLDAYQACDLPSDFVIY